MKLSFVRALVSIMWITSACASAPSPSTSGFAIQESVTLTPDSDGVSAILEIAQDQRLTASDIAALREHDPDQSLDSSPRFERDPLKSARLLLKTPDGHLIQSLPLEKPYATLETAEIGAGKRAILITQDFGIGMGSYNGPITQILETTPSSMTWAMAHPRGGRKPFRITLLRSLKSAWNFTSTPEGRDILAVDCRPNGASGDFTTRFSRYHRGKTGWVSLSRVKKDLWESESENGEIGYSLPDQKNFPILLAGRQ